MIRLATGLPPLPHIRRLPRPRPASESPPAEARFTYGRPFWFAFASNALLLVAVALLFRYADFVTLLGGTEFHLGWIVGAGMVGSIFTRLIVGRWIDRNGARPLWIGSLLLFVVTCFAHLTVASHTGAAIYLLRISYCCAVAGINGASMTFVSNQGPVKRMAELVGMLGTAGFLGSVVGTQLGDLLLGSVTVGRTQVVEMFLIAGLLGFLSMPLAWAATASDNRGPSSPLVPMFRVGTRKSSPSPLTVLRRHNPGLVLAVGVAMGFGLGLPATFLRPFAAGLGIPRIGLFFMLYAATAIVTRVLTRRWVERFGPRPIILLGLFGLAGSIVLFLLVRAEWQLVLPAIGFGCSHAVLFPSVVAAGSGSFPAGNRGMAILLMLATWDAGQLIGAPVAGAALRLARLNGLPPYPTMFLTVAGLLAVIGVWYAVGILWSKRSAAVASYGQFAPLRAWKIELSPLPKMKESVDFSDNSGSNIISVSGPAVVGQDVSAPSPAGGGMD